eukprot:1155955-Pelagomonas_calceolata.AAC.1
MGGEPFVLKASVKAHTQLPRPIQRPCPAMKLKSSLPKETARQPCSINAPKRGCGQCVELDRGATSPGTASQPTQWSDTQNKSWYAAAGRVCCYCRHCNSMSPLCQEGLALLAF